MNYYQIKHITGPVNGIYTIVENIVGARDIDAARKMLKVKKDRVLAYEKLPMYLKKYSILLQNEVKR